MRKVAIVGNIASGKSEVKNILLHYGYKVLDTDVVSHELLQSDNEVIQAFAEYDIFENSQISRKKLGELVFNNPELLERLENILHPKVRAAISDFFAKNDNDDILFVEIPLLFEAGMEDMFNDILFVYAPDELRLQRLMKRNGFTKDYALKRMNAQKSQDEKVNLATIVVKNDASLENLKSELTKLFMQ